MKSALFIVALFAVLRQSKQQQPAPDAISFQGPRGSNPPLPGLTLPSFLNLPPLPAVVAQQPAEPDSTSLRAGQNGKRTNNKQGTLSIPNAMLSLALSMCSRKDDPDNCSSNTVFSPLSISSSLTMLLMGTSGNSYQQLRTALGYHDGANDNDINGAYKFLMERVKKLDFEAGSSILLSVANGLFSQKNSAFNTNYIRNAREFYQSEVSELDILRNPQAASATINRWISSKTNGKITNIISSLSPDTQLVVANAVYFNANWADPFSPEATKLLDFFVSPREILSVPTMLTVSEVAYVESSDLGAKMIGIPYKGEDLGMFILVPMERVGLNGLKKLEERLTVDILEDLFSRMESKTLSIQLPKFRIQQKLQLKNALRGLGVIDLFSSDSADLSRMTGKSGTALDNIVHQTFIEVTESGTEAAAATVLNVSRGGSSKHFSATQPFLFFIRDIHSKAVLFFGRVVRPDVVRS